MRDRLIGADRPAELLALARILDRHLGGPLSDACELRADGDGQPVPPGVEVAGEPLAGSVRDEAVAASRVDRLEGLELDLGGGRDQRSFAVEGDHDVRGGQVAEEGALTVGEAAEGAGRLAGGELLQPLGALFVRPGGRDDEGGAGAAEERRRGAGDPTLLEQDGELHHAESLATVLLGDRDAGPPELRDLLPETVVVGAGLRELPHLLRLEAGGEELVCGPLDLLLLVVQVEVHGYLSLGSPKTRSAMMFFRTSVVPPSMEFARERRKR